MRFVVAKDDTLLVELKRGERVKAESDALVSMTETVRLCGRLDGGILSALFRKLFTGESFFFQELEARAAGDAMLAPSMPGSVLIEDTTGNPLLLQRGAFLACDSNVSITSEAQSNLVNGMLGGNGFFVLRASGSGPVAFSAYGSVHSFDLAEGETRAVDNGHVVAWSAGMPYNVELAVKNSVLSSLTSGEGLMCFFHGPGRVYVQSRSEESLRSLVHKNSPRGGSKGGSTPAACCAVIAVLFFVAVCAFAILAALTLGGGSAGSGDGFNFQRLQMFLDED